MLITVKAFKFVHCALNFWPIERENISPGDFDLSLEGTNMPGEQKVMEAITEFWGKGTPESGHGEKLRREKYGVKFGSLGNSGL